MTAFSTSDRWGAKVMACGFTVVPNCLITINEHLDDDEQISPTEMVVLLNLLSFWWDASKMPYPSKTTLGKRMGMSPRQTQRTLASLEKKRLITRVKRHQKSNEYDLSKLVALLRGVASK